jgi:hypothetical protein
MMMHAQLGCRVNSMDITSANVVAVVDVQFRPRLRIHRGDLALLALGDVGPSTCPLNPVTSPVSMRHRLMEFTRATDAVAHGVRLARAIGGRVARLGPGVGLSNFATVAQVHRHAKFRAGTPHADLQHSREPKFPRARSGQMTLWRTVFGRYGTGPVGCAEVSSRGRWAVGHSRTGYAEVGGI